MTTAFWIRTAAAFIFRSGRTTAALGAMIGIAVAALVFVSAVATGVNDCMIQNATGLYSGQISGTALPAALVPEDLELPGVSAVLRRYLIPGIISSLKDHAGQTAAAASGADLSLTLVALDPEPEKTACAFWKKIIAGTYPAPEKDDILISRQTALALSVQPGDPLLFRSGSFEKQFRVAGIFATGIPAMDQGLAFCPKAAMPVLPETWSTAVFLMPGVSETRIRSVWAEKGIDPSRFQTWQEAMPDLTQLIDLNRISMGFVNVLVLGVVAFATAAAFAISIISRLREYGIMKTMGITPGETVLLIFSQVILLNLMAAAAGILLGAAVAAFAAGTGIDLSGFTSHNQYFVVSGVIVPRLTVFSLLLPPGLALVFCLAAAAWPVLIVVRQQPARILRSI
ncbi:MAG: FtsX-like permease family protein [Desulfotignum sp.]|nr:FtsX-like permease family protein [Desulfotignum sp.]